MPFHEPTWWYDRHPRWQALGLLPLGWTYGLASTARMVLARPYVSTLPVICVGNFTAGGTGKTPAALAIADLVRNLGREPVFLSRGFGGTLNGPLFVDTGRHTAHDIGDEPLLLARSAPVVIARRRQEGARLIEENAKARTVIIMDDGLQNPSIAKSLAIVMTDGKRGLGNGFCLPAGPLRAPMGVQARHANVVVLNGAESSDGDIPGVAKLRRNFAGPILRATTEPLEDAKKFRGARVLAYTGIANPGRVFALLTNLGAEIAARRSFPDHHDFTAKEAGELLAEAKTLSAALVTTEKDLARLYGHADRSVQSLAAQSATLPIRLKFGDKDRAELIAMIGRAIQIRPA